VADDLTPEEYLARLNAEADRIASEPPRPDPSGVLQPGQALRDVLTQVEIEGMRAFARRTGGEQAVAEFDAELDTPWDPAETDRVIEELQAEQATAAAATAVRGPGRGSRVAAVVGVAVVAVVVAGVVAVTSGGSDDDPVTDLAEASGAARDRGEEVLALADQLDAPPGWTQQGEPELSISGDEDTSYAFADLEWHLPRGAEVSDVHAWFADLPLAKDRPDDARCSSTLSGNEGGCEVDLYALDATGERDYDAPRQRVTVSFYAAGTDALGPDRISVVLAEVYSTD
jgi:hypothetical protein